MQHSGTPSGQLRKDKCKRSKGPASGFLYESRICAVAPEDFAQSRSLDNYILSWRYQGKSLIERGLSDLGEDR